MSEAADIAPAVALRAVTADDLPAFFAHQADSAANIMAAFGAEDPNDLQAFMAKWARILADETIVMRTITVDQALVGYVGHFVQFGRPSISYWIGRQYWGRGIAKAAVRAFLPSIPTRPLHARVAEDNVASLSVLIQCGFVVDGEDRAFANARGCEIRELTLVLRGG